jgi:hypothetical protein
VAASRMGTILAMEADRASARAGMVENERLPIVSRDRRRASLLGRAQRLAVPA